MGVLYPHLPGVMQTLRLTGGTTHDQGRNKEEGEGLIQGSKRWHLKGLMWPTVMGVTESKTSPRHLKFLGQLKKTNEVLLLFRVFFLDTLVHEGVKEEHNF